jgi:hypothetical protein
MFYKICVYKIKSMHVQFVYVCLARQRWRFLWGQGPLLGSSPTMR